MKETVVQFYGCHMHKNKQYQWWSGLVPLLIWLSNAEEIYVSGRIFMGPVSSAVDAMCWISSSLWLMLTSIFCCCFGTCEFFLSLGILFFNLGFLPSNSVHTFLWRIILYWYEIYIFTILNCYHIYRKGSEFNESVVLLL